MMKKKEFKIKKANKVFNKGGKKCNKVGNSGKICIFLFHEKFNRRV